MPSTQIFGWEKAHKLFSLCAACLPAREMPVCVVGDASRKWSSHGRIQKCWQCIQIFALKSTKMISELDERLKKARPTRRNESRVVYVEGVSGHGTQ